MVRETKGGRLRPALEFFQGLTPDDRRRLRWDRLVALHLVVMSFLNEFGYEEQGSSSELFVMVANQIRDPKIAQNLLGLLERLGLQEHTKDIAVAAKQITDGVADPFDYRLVDGRKQRSSPR